MEAPRSSAVISSHSSEMLWGGHAAVPYEIYCNYGGSLDAHAATACVLHSAAQRSTNQGSVGVFFELGGICAVSSLVPPSDGSGRDRASSQLCCISVIFTAMSVSGVNHDIIKCPNLPLWLTLNVPASIWNREGQPTCPPPFKASEACFSNRKRNPEHSGKGRRHRQIILSFHVLCCRCNLAITILRHGHKMTVELQPP